LIDVQVHAEGIIFAVRAQPGARRNEIRGEHAGALRVCVSQAPEKGKANRAIRDLLAQTLKVNRSQVALLSGETASLKRFLIRGLTEDQLRERLPPCCPP
jgi:uncharacterized protein (TIGR00251 family)